MDLIGHQIIELQVHDERGHRLHLRVWMKHNGTEKFLIHFLEKGSLLEIIGIVNELVNQGASIKENWQRTAAIGRVWGPDVDYIPEGERRYYAAL